MVDVQQISKLGVGGWGVGGLATREPDNDDAAQVDAMAYALDKGLNYLEVNFWNAEGRSAELMKQALDRAGKKRDDVFIALVIYDYKNPRLTDVENEIQQFFRLFQTSYIDTLEFALSALHTYGFDPVVDFVQGQLESGKTRYTSLTNANLDYLQQYHREFGSKLFSHEVHFSFEVRDNEYLGILDYATSHNIKNVIYQPLRRNRTAQRNWELLARLAQQYGKTQNQIILNWLVQKGYLPLVKSQHRKHIDENAAALEFVIAREDIEALDTFTIPNYRQQPIDWFVEGTGPTIFSLPNSFDEQYPDHQR